MITGEAEYKGLNVSIRDSLNTAFRDVQLYQSEYEGFKKMYLENRKLDPAKIKSDDPDLEWFKEQMDMYKAQHDDVSGIRVKKKVTSAAKVAAGPARGKGTWWRQGRR